MEETREKLKQVTSDFANFAFVRGIENLERSYVALKVKEMITQFHLAEDLNLIEDKACPLYSLSVDYNIKPLFDITKGVAISLNWRWENCDPNLWHMCTLYGSGEIGELDTYIHNTYLR